MALRSQPSGHQSADVPRLGAGLIGTALVAVGVLAVVGRIAPTTTGVAVAGLSAGEVVGFVAAAFGSLLVGGAVLGGGFVCALTAVLGSAFLLTGAAALAAAGLDPHPPSLLGVPGALGVLAAGGALLALGVPGFWSPPARGRR